MTSASAVQETTKNFKAPQHQEERTLSTRDARLGAVWLALPDRFGSRMADDDDLDDRDDGHCDEQY